MTHVTRKTRQGVNLLSYLDGSDKALETSKLDQISKYHLLRRRKIDNGLDDRFGQTLAICV